MVARTAADQQAFEAARAHVKISARMRADHRGGTAWHVMATVTAPPGSEALYVLVHTPYLRPHHDWKQMFPAYRRVILDKLKTTGRMPDIEERIVFEKALTPQDIHDRYRVLDGAIYGIASHGKWLGAFKPANRSRDLKGLYLAGGAAHPGPGMPMVLMSGWIAADSLDQDDIAPKPRPAATRVALPV